jgi:hypothetical protein
MTSGISLSARLIASAILATAFAARAHAAYGCGGYAEAVPATIIVAAPEMRAPVSHAGMCLPLNAQAFLERRRAEAQMAASAPQETRDGLAGRFYMTQNGRRMTADDFDAWMQAKGIRVAKGKAPEPTAAPVVEDAKNR